MSDVEWMTVAEIARHLKLSRMTVYRLIADRTLPASKFGRTFRVARKDYQFYLEASKL